METNALAYYVTALITTVKIFTATARGEKTDERLKYCLRLLDNYKCNEPISQVNYFSRACLIKLFTAVSK
jgi:hypothetical protein